MTAATGDGRRHRDDRASRGNHGPRLAAADLSILVASVSHSGQLNPVRAIVGELVRRGVRRVHVVTHADVLPELTRQFGDEVAFSSFGLRSWQQYGERDYVAMTAPPRTTCAARLNMRLLCDPDRYEAEFVCLRESFDRVRPRVVLADVMTWPAIDAALTRRIPLVLNVPSLVSSPFSGDWPFRFPCVGSGLRWDMTRRERLANAAFALRIQATAFCRTPFLSLCLRRRRLGVAHPFAHPKVYQRHAAAVLADSVPGLDYPHDHPPNLHFVGAVLPAARDEMSPGEADVIAGTTLDEWLDRHPRIVLINLGTLVRLDRAQVDELLRGLARLDAAILWRLPLEQSRFLPDPTVLGERLRIEAWLPSQVTVLRHPNVKVFVTHGGANSFHEGLACAKPLFAMPFWLDCYDFAVRAVDRGVGLTLERPPAFNADEIERKISTLLDTPAFADAAAWWSRELGTAGGAARAADIVIEQARRWPR